MADSSVFVEGFGDGSFADAIRGIPPWATQSTLFDVKNILIKAGKDSNDNFEDLIAAIKGIGTSSGGGTDPAKQKKINDALDDYLDLLDDLTDEAAKRAQREKAAAAAEQKDKEENSLSYKAAGKVLSGLAIAGAKLSGVQKQYFTTSNDLYKSGINLLAGQDSTQSSMMALNSMITLSGLRLETFQKVVQQYSASINAVGVNKFAKSLSESRQGLMSLGFNSEEQAELMGSMIDSMSSYTDLRGRSETQLANDAMVLGGQLTKMSLQYGISTKQLQENMKSFGASADSQVMAALYGEEAANNFNVAISGIKDQGARNLLQTLGASEYAESTKEFASIAAAGAGDIGTEMVSILRTATNNPLEAQESMLKLAASVSDERIRALAVQRSAGNEAAAAMLNILAPLRTQSLQSSKATDKQTQAATDNQAVLSSFSSEYEKLLAGAQRAFPLLEKQVDIATTGLKALNSAIDASISVFEAETRSWIGVGVQIMAMAASVLAGFGLQKLFTRGMVGSLSTAGTAARSFGSSLMTAMKPLSGLLSTAGSAVGSFGARLMIAMKPLALVAAAFGIMIAVIQGIDSAFAAMGFGGKTIDTKQDEDNWKRMSALEKAQSGLARGIETAGSFLGMETITNEATADRVKSETEYLNKKQGVTGGSPTKISVPTAPAPSTVDSPSAVSPTSAGAASSPGPGDTSPQMPTNTVIEKPARTADINSLIEHQSTVLSQLLMETRSLVSVNKDILRYSRMQS